MQNAVDCLTVMSAKVYFVIFTITELADEYGFNPQKFPKGADVRQGLPMLNVLAVFQAKVLSFKSWRSDYFLE